MEETEHPKTKKNERGKYACRICGEKGHTYTTCKYNPKKKLRYNTSSSLENNSNIRVVVPTVSTLSLPQSQSLHKGKTCVICGEHRHLVHDTQWDRNNMVRNYNMFRSKYPHLGVNIGLIAKTISNFINPFSLDKPNDIYTNYFERNRNTSAVPTTQTFIADIINSYMYMTDFILPSNDCLNISGGAYLESSNEGNKTQLLSHDTRAKIKYATLLSQSEQISRNMSMPPLDIYNLKEVNIPHPSDFVNIDVTVDNKSSRDNHSRVVENIVRRNLNSPYVIDSSNDTKSPTNISYSYPTSLREEDSIYNISGVTDSCNSASSYSSACDDDIDQNMPSAALLEYIHRMSSKKMANRNDSDNSSNDSNNLYETFDYSALVAMGVVVEEYIRAMMKSWIENNKSVNSQSNMSGFLQFSDEILINESSIQMRGADINHSEVSKYLKNRLEILFGMDLTSYNEVIEECVTNEINRRQFT